MFGICKAWKRMRQWIFLWLNFVILLENTVPNNMVKGTFWKFSRKSSHFKLWKPPRFFQDLGRFLAFFWNCYIWLIGSIVQQHVIRFQDFLLLNIARFGLILLWLIATFGATYENWKKALGSGFEFQGFQQEAVNFLLFSTKPFMNYFVLNISHRYGTRPTLVCIMGS